MDLKDSNQKPSETKGSNGPAHEHPTQGPPPVPPAIAVSQPPPPPDEHGESNKKHRDWVDYLTIGLETFGLIVLVAYTTFAALQWCEIRNTNRLTQSALDNSKNQFRQDQRPYIWLANETKDSPNMVFQTLDFISPSKGKLHQIAVTMLFTNFGKSPAILIRHYHGIRLGDENETFTIIPRWVDDSRILPPGKIDTFSAQSDTFLTDTQLSEYTRVPARAGMKVFATWQYADSGGHRYETEICLGRLNLGGWAYCKNHTEIKDCAEKACEP
jgi:hypothetical protein